MSKITKIDSEHLVAENLQYQLFQLSDIQTKRIELPYSEKDISSDGALIVLRELEKQTGIISGMCKCIIDDRDQRYINHSLKNYCPSVFIK